MIRITDKTKCCGCTACMNICPAQCIVMRRDREGFDYPVANPDLCIDCGKCELVCPVLNPHEPSEPLEALAARKDEFIEGSSSGGVFPAIASKVIEDGGIVYGAVVNEDMTIGHIDAENMDGVERMRGSKYVQSDLYGTFDEVKYWLNEGRKVLYTGTPCQIAGLKSYLGREHEGLLTMDCACHGVPAPGLWEKYAKAQGTAHGGIMKDVHFRNKGKSWMHYEISYAYSLVEPNFRKVKGESVRALADGTVETCRPYMRDPFMALFVQNMSLRPSCYRCPARKGRSGSDLTLADLWSVRQSAPAFDDDKGVSLVLANTEKGLETLASSDLESVTLDVSAAMKNNGGFAESVPVPEKRTEFFKGHHSAEDIVKYMEGYVVRRPLLSIYKSVRRTLSDLKRKLKK